MNTHIQSKLIPKKRFKDLKVGDLFRNTVTPEGPLFMCVALNSGGEGPSFISAIQIDGPNPGYEKTLSLDNISCIVYKQVEPLQIVESL